MMDLDARLSPHFTLRELLVTAHREIDNTPSGQIVARLQALAQGFLEPVRERFGAIYVTSGYRCPQLNEAIGGSKHSAHMLGCAADFVAYDRSVTPTDIARWIIERSDLDFDQVIDERSSTSGWVHLGMLRPGYDPQPRGEAMIRPWPLQRPRYIPFYTEEQNE